MILNERIWETQGSANDIWDKMAKGIKKVVKEILANQEAL